MVKFATDTRDLGRSHTHTHTQNFAKNFGNFCQILLKFAKMLLYLPKWWGSVDFWYINIGVGKKSTGLDEAGYTVPPDKPPVSMCEGSNGNECSGHRLAGRQWDMGQYIQR